MPATLELPDWLIQLLEREGAAVDLEVVARRMAAKGVSEVIYLGFAGGPEALGVRGPGLDVVVEVSDDGPTPVAAALEELVAFLVDFGALRQLHSALQDMDLVAHAARELANALDADDWTHPLLQHHQMLETGIITMYSRNFTGRAALGDSWRPPAGARRDLHERILRLRHTVYAHADWTASRTIDTNVMLGDSGPPILVESRSSLSAQALREIAELAETQQARFWDASGEMKQRLGAANAPPPEPRG